MRGGSGYRRSGSQTKKQPYPEIDIQQNGGDKIVETHSLTDSDYSVRDYMVANGIHPPREARREFFSSSNISSIENADYFRFPMDLWHKYNLTMTAPENSFRRMIDDMMWNNANSNNFPGNSEKR